MHLHDSINKHNQSQILWLITQLSVILLCFCVLSELHTFCKHQWTNYKSSSPRAWHTPSTPHAASVWPRTRPTSTASNTTTSTTTKACSSSSSTHSSPWWASSSTTWSSPSWLLFFYIKSVFTIIFDWLYNKIYITVRTSLDQNYHAFYSNLNSSTRNFILFRSNIFFNQNFR